jgi:hypothetical protein
MKIREKEGRTEISGKNVFKKSRKKGKTNKKKEKMESGVANNPLITKKKNFALEDLQNKTKKICKLKIPLKKNVYMSLTFHNLWNIYIYIYILFQHLHLYIFLK